MAKPASGPAAEETPAPGPGILDSPERYRLARGFSYRREAFGGLLYHYEGLRPDPKIYFIDSPFLVALLEIVDAHPGFSLGAVVAAVRERHGLSNGQLAAMDAFFSMLAERGALVRQ